MHLQKRTQYGLRAAVRLAGKYPDGGYVQSRDLADEEHLPTKFLEQVLLILRRAGLLESKVGSGGGYRLKRPPNRITVAQMLSALEPPEELDHREPRTVGCRAVELVSERLASQREKVCAKWTLADLTEEAARDAKSAGAMYYI